MSANGSPDVGSIKKVENPTVCVYVSICWIINFNRILKKPLECLKSVWMFNYQAMNEVGQIIFSGAADETDAMANHLEICKEDL